MSSHFAHPDYREDLGNGLIARWATTTDLDQLWALISIVWGDNETAPPSPRMLDQLQAYTQADFPFGSVHDFAVIEDTNQAKHPLVATAVFWRHQWCYAGVPFGVGRPEMVGTLPAFRNRGLVRQLFAMHHARSAAEGHLMQGVTGIPYFYRQFGYEYVFDLDVERKVQLNQLPAVNATLADQWSLRPATEADVALLVKLYAQRCSKGLVWAEASADYWRYLVRYWQAHAETDFATAGVGLRPYIFVHSEWGACGYTLLAVRRWGPWFPVFELLLDAALDLPTALPALLLAVRLEGERAASMTPAATEYRGLTLQLGREHSVYELLGEERAPRGNPPYAWYIRVPDLPAFLRHIMPVLNERLARSYYHRYNGELRFDLYRGGVRFQLDAGRITQIDPWQAPPYHAAAELGSPPLTVLQLILGHRSVDELRTIFPDFWVEESARLLIETLFPKQPSVVQPLL